MIDLNDILENAKKELSEVENSQKLGEFYQTYLGKSGKVTTLLSKMREIPNEERKEFGIKINNIKEVLQSLISEKENFFIERKVQDKLNKTKLIDLTIPSTEKRGSLHPITIIQNNIIEIFSSMGFTVEDGNEIETEYNNFEAVNVPKNHPARDMQDTFYLDNGQVLKTQTSAAQNRIMRKYGAPLKAIFPGRCFRNEELDASHENTFFQIEGMMIDKDVSIANLIYFMKEMLVKVFGKEIEVRLRPGFFPFVEPGFELDISCPYCKGKGCRVCKNSGWIELCPCGMIHPNVLKMGGIDPEEYRGFAFGLGFSRLAMMDFGITEIRLLNSGNIKALLQAKIK
ncbi:MAG: phenylalanine--tRNA ligase subunit alpha [Clostridia bacterium]|nr:phenylalanine--tRNA ligase subunit alpha [Clostridia bacterium]